jgi:2-methylcitrate dehydratase PrpD
LPPSVADKVKALVLHALASAVLGSGTAAAKEAVHLTLAEEGKPDGATILAHGGSATRVGAAYANAELMHASYLFDSYRMLTHPGPVLVPAALANAELEGKGGADLITALAAGYEFVCRLADDFIPSTAARGFRPSPLYATLGAALASGKLMGLDEDGLVSAIALAANFASGLNEGPRVGGNELAIHEPQAARNGVFAGLMARLGHVKGAELSIEGDAGFYNAFTGSSKGELTYSFKELERVDLASITEGLGKRYKLLTAMFRMYPCPGYNQPVIELVSEMKHRHSIDAQDVGFPVVGGRTFGPTGARLEEDERVLAFMNQRVKLVQEKQRAMFSPAITVTMKDGRSFRGEYPYARLEWDFAQLASRLQECLPGYALGKQGFDALVQLVQGLDRLPAMAAIFDATSLKENS